MFVLEVYRMGVQQILKLNTEKTIEKSQAHEEI